MSWIKKNGRIAESKKSFLSHIDFQLQFSKGKNHQIFTIFFLRFFACVGKVARVARFRQTLEMN